MWVLVECNTQNVVYMLLTAHYSVTHLTWVYGTNGWLLTLRRQHIVNLVVLELAFTKTCRRLHKHTHDTKYAHRKSVNEHCEFSFNHHWTMYWPYPVWELWKNSWGALANMGRGAAGAEGGVVWGGVGLWRGLCPSTEIFFSFLPQNSAFWRLFW